MFNGFLLIPNLDIAFDKGLITFDDNGAIPVSSQLDEIACKILGINSEMELVKVEPAHKSYLQYHRERIFKP